MIDSLIGVLLMTRIRWKSSSNSPQHRRPDVFCHKVSGTQQSVCEPLHTSKNPICLFANLAKSHVYRH
jgi:hypothetical protein